MFPSQRWWISFPFVLALAALIFLGWGVSLAVTYPYDGLTEITPTGLVKEVDQAGPTARIIESQDQILFVNGVPVLRAFPYYRNQHAGDQAVLEIDRNGTRIRVPFYLQIPPFNETFSRLAPFFLALVFWGIGVGIQAFKPAREAGNLFFLFFEISAIFLIAGATTSIGPAWTVFFYGFLLWLIGPLMVHFHVYFPQSTSFRGQRYLLISLYTLGVVGGLAYIVARPYPESFIFTNLVFASRIFMAVCFCLGLALLFYSYRHATTAGVRGKIRIVVLGAFLGFFPLVMLVILPDALFNETVIPYSYVFVLFAIFPLTYGYAIFRHRLVEIERHVNRGATFILVYTILGGFYLLLYNLLAGLFSSYYFNEPVVNTVLVLILATVFVPLHRYIQRIVDRAFYGGWYDYRSAITEITQGLEQITNLNSLGETVSDRLVRTLRLEESCVFLTDLDGAFSIVQVAPRPLNEGRSQTTFSPLPRSSLSYLLNMGGAVERTALREALKDVKISPEEHELLNSQQVYLWVPVVGHGQVIGLLALGPKFGGDVFSGEDMDILRVVARQLGPLIENIHLVTRLRRHAAELEQRVTERTEELAEAKKRVEAILASVGEGVVVTDLDGRIVAVNQAYEVQSGYRESELVGQEIWSYYAGGDAAIVLGDMREALQYERVWNREMVGYRRAGEQFDVQITFASLRDEGNRIIGYVGSQRDVTQQKELNRLKDLFVSDVSHELRTPTTNISLYLELLENAPPHKRPEYLAVLKEQTRLLIKLVEDILDLSRLTIGKTRKIEFTDVDLNEVVEEVITAHRPLAEASGLVLDYNPDLNLPLVWGESNQLARVVNNLVSNAIHYTVHGGVFVRTFTENGDACLEVRDTGIGIDPEDQVHIFERFYRGRRVRQSKIHGTGLGLAIVKEIVDLHGSEIEIQSNVGKGSTFLIRFPVQVKEPWQEKVF